jgi:membrane-associated phospholipid phosphatase
MTNTRRYLVLAIISVALLLAFRLTSPSENPAWDVAILDWFAKQRTPLLDRLMIVVTWLGSFYTVALAAILIAWRLFKRKRQQDAWLLLSALGYGALIGRIAKWWIDRPRPDMHIWLSNLPMDSSYPSLHSLQAMAFFLALALIVRRTWFWPIALTVAVMVAISRLYLQVHYPSDITAGLLGAILWTLAIYWTRNSNAK